MTGYFVVNGTIVAVSGEQEALACARSQLPTGEPNPGFIAGVVYWTVEGAQDELNRVTGRPTLTDIAYAASLPPRPPGVKI